MGRRLRWNRLPSSDAPMTVPAIVVAVFAASDDLLLLAELPFVDIPQFGQKFAPSATGAPQEEQ